MPVTSPVPRDRAVVRFRHQFDSALSAHDPARAAVLLESHCDDLFARGEARVFADCIRRISVPGQALHPRTMLALAWRLTVQWRFDEARHLLCAARERIAAIERNGNGCEAVHLRLLLEHRHVMLAQCQDDLSPVYTSGRELIERFPAANHYVKASLFTAVLHAAREQYRLGDLDRSDALARDCLQQSMSWHALAIHESVAGAAFFMAGRCDAAVAAFRAGLQVVMRLGGAGRSLGALTALPLAELLYEQNSLHEASTLTADYLPVANELGFADQLISGWLTAARLCRRRGDAAEAFDVLERASSIAATRGFARLGAWVLAERARTLTDTARPDVLEQEFANIHKQCSPETLMPRLGVTTTHEARALAWVRIGAALGRISDSIDVARRWCSFTTLRGAVRSRVRWEVLLAKLLRLDGQSSLAVRMLGRAATAAAPGRLFATFIDEGPQVEGLLRLRADGFARCGEVTRAFVARLLPMFGEPIGGAPLRLQLDARNGRAGTLSAREVQVLSLAGKGWRNQDIGSRLGMTEGTVKWYLHQIYQKLGASRRAHAAEEARRIGLID